MSQDSAPLWQGVAAIHGLAGAATGAASEAPDPASLPTQRPPLCRSEAWREHPAFLLLHQTYLMLAEPLPEASVKGMKGLDPAKRQQLRIRGHARSPTR